MPPPPAPMPLDRWPRVKALFEEALARPADTRAAFLDDLGDPALRAEVERLLALDAEADTYFGDLADEVCGAADGADAAPVAEAGPWRLRELVGHGGMGAVYRAERADGAYRQAAAVKLIRRGVYGDEAAVRFRVERQALAALRHPNIARLLGGGVLPDGLPWLAMEYVDGEPITAYCDRRRLSVEARLRLFLAVCDAVEHAHRRLVVHRDLKPSNVLVAETESDDREPRPVLLDFGLAKLLEDEPGVTVPLTAEGRRALTPEYAAPEQFTGGEVTTATDVYSLGVLLFELLTGHRPYALARGGPEAVAEAVLGQEPARPSAAVVQTRERRSAYGETRTVTPEEVGAARAASPPQLQRRLRGDLDRIVLKALRKGPERRYASADALADDLRRHLAGEPVAARPATFGYRAGRFVRRHRAGVAATALVVLSLVGGLGAALWQAAEARAAQARTEREAGTAERTADFLVSLFEGASPGVALGDSLTANDLLQRGAERLESELVDEPLIHARLLDAVAEAHRSLGDLARADSLFQRSADVLRPVRAEAPIPYAIALGNLGMIRGQRGDLEAAERLLSEAIARFEATGDTLSLDFGRVQNQLAIMLFRRGDYAAAVPYLRRVIAADRAASEAAGAPIEGLPIHLDNLGSVLLFLGRYEEAEPVMREGLALHQQLHGDLHPSVVISMGNLATLLNNVGRSEEAEALSREALARNVRLHGEAHPSVAIGQGKLGSVLLGREKFDEALELYRRSLVTKRAVYGDHHASTVVALIGAGEALRMGGRPGEAVPLLREAVEAAEVAVPPGHVRDRDARRELARALHATGDTDGARAVIRRGIERLGALETPAPEARAHLEEALAELDAPADAASGRGR